MTVEEIIKTPEYRTLMADYQDMCLWFAPEDFSPKDEGQLLFVLDNIDKYGTLDADRRAGRIRAWLSQSFSQKC